MSSFPDSFDQISPDSHLAGSLDDEDGYVAAGDCVPPPYSNSVDSESPIDRLGVDDSPVFNNDTVAAFGYGEYVFASNPTENGGFVESNGPILPPPDEMQEEGFALQEWRRRNAILLEQKEKSEKEILSQIIEEANEYKIAFHDKRKVTCENYKTNNREKEKVFLTNQEKFHKEADKNYWKAISELIPHEIRAIEKKRGKKDQEKKPSIVVIQGPKPGKPTDLARMRHILVKLKHTTPDHLKLTPPPPPPPATTKGGKTGGAATAPPDAALEAVVAA